MAPLPSRWPCWGRAANPTVRPLREAAQDKRVEARLAALMALVISAVWDKLESYDILPD